MEAPRGRQILSEKNPQLKNTPIFFSDVKWEKKRYQGEEMLMSIK